MKYDIEPHLDSCSNFNLWGVNYSTREIRSPYKLGAWGVDYLLDKVKTRILFGKHYGPIQMKWDGMVLLNTLLD